MGKEGEVFSFHRSKLPLYCSVQSEFKILPELSLSMRLGVIYMSGMSQCVTRSQVKSGNTNM